MSAIVDLVQITQKDLPHPNMYIGLFRTSVPHCDCVYALEHLFNMPTFDETATYTPTTVTAYSVTDTIEAPKIVTQYKKAKMNRYIEITAFLHQN